jgi:hypothetical protein
MTRRIAWALGLLCIAGTVVSARASEDAAATLKELNALLQSSSLPKYVLTLAADGTVVDKNKYGATTTYNLRDIGDIGVDLEHSDAETIILVRCRDGKACVEFQSSPEAAKKKTTFKVFSIYPADAAPEVMRLLKDLQAAAAKK